MASETLANQSSTLSITQRLSISIEVEQTLEIEGAAGFTNEQLINAINNSNASLDISSIILQVLGQFNPANLGNTDISGTITISGDAIVNNVDSQTINTGVLSVGDELIIGESSTFSLITKIEDFETTITSFNNRIENMEGNIYVNDISQTFFQISTQQPHKFAASSNPAIPLSITSSSIIINWNFDNIMAKYNNLPLDFILNNEDSTKNSQLPCINNIIIDISGKYEGLNSNIKSGWLNLYTFNINNNENYNNTNYKEFTINKTDYSSNLNINNLLTNSNNFDIRVYGVNNAVNYPTIENRALLFEQLKFELARVPSQPIFVSNQIQNPSLNTLTLTFFVNETELGLPNSNALINKLEIVYNLLQTFRSSVYSVDALSSPDITNFINPLYQKNTNFSGLLENLMPGSKYNFQARVQNNLNDNSFSQYSLQEETNYTLLPDSNGFNTIINVNIASNKEYITNNFSLNNNQIIYINIADVNHSLNYEKIGLQYIEITNPDASTSGSQNKGFGNLIDNINDLVVINVYVENINKQTISYDGDFNSNSQARNVNSSSFISITGQSSLNDMYNTSNKGLRLLGNFSLNSIPNTDIVNKIGSPRTTPYELRYEYIRHPDVGGSNLTKNQYIYVDNLNIDPLIDYNEIINDTSNGVIDVLYNMGIPSIMTFYIAFTRYYKNINSSNLFIRGDKKISTIGAINNTSINSEQIVLITNQTDINASGVYSSSLTNMPTLNNSYYNSINYISSRLTNNLNVIWSEKVYNLYRPNGITSATSNTTLNTNHYCDYNSFNYSSGKINSPKINLSNIHLYELNNITALGSNLNNLGFIHYTSHLTQIANHSLLYIDGKFQSNKTQNYPIMSDFSYNPLNSIISNNYSAGNINYDLNGQLTTTLNSGYKFIAFQIRKSTNPQSPESYIFNNNTYNRIYFDSKYYISIKSMLNGLFNTSTINNIFDINNNDAIGFVKVTKQSGNAIRWGNLKQEYNPVGGNWIENGGISTSYSGTLNFNYGTKVENDNGDIGIYIDPTAVNDDLMLIIGLKNN